MGMEARDFSRVRLHLAIMNATGKDEVCGVNKTLQRKELEKEADKAMKLSDELERKLFTD